MKHDLTTLRGLFEDYLRGRLPLDTLVTLLSQNELDCALKGLSDAHPSIEFAAMNVPVVTWRAKS